MGIFNVFTFKKENQVEISSCSWANSFISIVHFHLWKLTQAPKWACSVAGSIRVLAWLQSQLCVREHRCSGKAMPPTSSSLPPATWWYPEDEDPHCSCSFASAMSISWKDPLGLIPQLHKLWLHLCLLEELLISSSLYSLLYSDMAFFLQLEPRGLVQPLDGFLWVVSSVADGLKSKESVFYAAASYVQLSDWHYFRLSV